jgi:hypothetical protein
MRKILGLFFVLCLLAVSIAQATLTGSYSVNLDPATQVSIAFRTSTAGPILVETERTFSAQSLRLSILVEGSSDPIAKIEGPVPLKVNLEQALENVNYSVLVENLGTTRASGRINITYPVANCTEAAIEFKTAFSYTDRTVPFELDQCKVMLQVLRSLPRPFPAGVTRIERVPASGGIAGSYHPGLTPRIRIYGDFRGGELARIFYHEVGHHVQFAHFSNAQQQRWTELHKLSGSESSYYARLYGRENEYEDWASVFEAYTRDSIFEVNLARNANEKGSDVLREKYKFISQLFRHERDGQARTYIFRTDRIGLEVAILNRASVPFDESGLPSATGELIWEEF